MGLLKTVGEAIGGAVKVVAGNVGNAALSAGAGALHDVFYREYFESGDMSQGVLMCRGQRILDGKRNGNVGSNNNVISSGALVDVQMNQCMIIVENGAVVECCTEPGRYVFDNSTAPSFFCGNNKGLGAAFEEAKQRFLNGGGRVSTQRIYYINMGRIWEPILWGLGNVGFTHSFQPVETMPPLRINVMLKCHGSIGVRIQDPMAFFKEIGAQMSGGDNNGRITVDTLDGNLFLTAKQSISSAVNSAISTVSREETVAYTHIMNYSDQITAKITEKLQSTSLVMAGFGFYDFNIPENPTMSDEDYKKIMELEEKYNMVSNPMLAQYDIQKTMARGFENAGNNGGAAGLVGIGMASNMGGMGPMGGLGNFSGYQQPQYQQPAYQPAPQQPPVQPAAVVAPAPAQDAWTCACGVQNTSKFCQNCGSSKPNANNQQQSANPTWTCACGATNTGKFCAECGQKKPTVKKYQCDKCGWKPADGKAVRFCPECGDIFNDEDIIEG